MTVLSTLAFSLSFLTPPFFSAATPHPPQAFASITSAQRMADKFVNSSEGGGGGEEGEGKQDLALDMGISQQQQQQLPQPSDGRDGCAGSSGVLPPPCPPSLPSPSGPTAQARGAAPRTAVGVERCVKWDTQHKAWLVLLAVSPSMSLKVGYFYEKSEAVAAEQQAYSEYQATCDIAGPLKGMIASLHNYTVSNDLSELAQIRHQMEQQQLGISKQA